MIRKLVLLVFLFWSICSCDPVFSQSSMILKFMDGGKKRFILTDVRKITFSDNDLILTENNQSQVRYEMEMLQHISFSASTLSANNTVAENQTGIHIYPNPASDFINIKTDTDRLVEVLLYLPDGNIIFKKIIYSNEIIDISYLPSGIYILKAFNRITKLIKL